MALVLLWVSFCWFQLRMWYGVVPRWGLNKLFSDSEEQCLVWSDSHPKSFTMAVTAVGFFSAPARGVHGKRSGSPYPVSQCTSGDKDPILISSTQSLGILKLCRPWIVNVWVSVHCSPKGKPINQLWCHWCNWFHCNLLLVSKYTGLSCEFRAWLSMVCWC